MNFLKRHKIATVTLLTVLILSAGLIWFVKDKLDRITYDDGKVTETEVTKPDDGEVGESVPGTEQEPAGETPQKKTFLPANSFQLLPCPVGHSHYKNTQKFIFCQQLPIFLLTKMCLIFFCWAQTSVLTVTVPFPGQIP